VKLVLRAWGRMDNADLYGVGDGDQESEAAAGVFSCLGSRLKISG
jgi:hypothetical protein